MDREEALVERLFLATLGSLELFGVFLGERLGLYAALADGAPCTAPELASRAGIGTVEVLPIENDFFRFYRLRV